MPSEARIPVCSKTFRLNNGRSIPAVGLGTWQGQFGTDETEALKKSIIYALNNGYHLIDTAQYYGIESVVGEAIRDSGIRRENITVITKLWGSSFHDPAAALQKSLSDMNIGYIDLFLMHWPNTMSPDDQPQKYPGDPPFWEAWKSMEKLVGDKCKSIGVSNFTQKTLDKLLENATIVPAVNEVELHALNPNNKLVPYCDDKGIRVISWSTLGSERLDTGTNPILTDKLFVDIATKYKCSTGVVSLSWAVQRGVVVIPKSSKLHRIDENIRLVTLDDESMEAISHATDTIEKIRLVHIIPGLQYQLDGKDTILGWSVEDFGWEDKDGNWLA
ncbi:hypothetical protein LTR86_006930 [Recurvomyces mirabilis]|nr:hypothetical protein LTR86_006930 [Recurvomyces mirabilis]